LFFPSVFQHMSFTRACAYTTPEGLIMKYVYMMYIILWLKNVYSLWSRKFTAEQCSFVSSTEAKSWQPQI